VSEEALGGLPVTATVGDAHLDAVGVTVRESAVLHTALDTVVGTPWRAATVVDDDGRLAGVVTADGVASALQRTR
jgi:CBS domain-containing protein